MAETRFARGDAMTVEHWARVLQYDVIYRSEISGLIGESPDSIIHLKTETSKDSGDKVTFAIQAKLTGAGFTENQVAQGNGESLSIHSDSVVINELGHVVEVPNAGRSIDAQRVPFNLRDAARTGLRDWKQERMSVAFFNQVCGYTPQTDLRYTGLNAATAPTRSIVLDTDASYAALTNDEDLAAGDTFTLRHVDIAREVAEAPSSGVPLRPINIKGRAGGQDISGGKYCMYLHPWQVTDLRTNTDTGQWLDIQKAAMQGGSVSNNMIYSDALGEYNNVILKKANHVTPGVNSSTGASIATVRRAVFLGAQACAIAYSKGGGKNVYGWNEELYDHKRRLEVSSMAMMGMKKCQFRSADFGVITVPTYAAAHA